MRSLFFIAIFSALVLMIEGSSHSEAPGTSNAPATDITDFFMFQSYETGRTGFTTLIATFNPRHPPFGGPNYYALDPNFHYNIYLDNNGDGLTDLQFQFTVLNELAAGGRGLSLPVGRNQQIYVPLKALSPITAGNNAGLNFLEYYRLNFINYAGSSGAVTNAATGDVTFIKPWDNVGTKTFPNYPNYQAQYLYNVNIPGCATAGKVFVGQTADPFSINIGKIFDLVNFVPIDGAAPSNFPGGITNDPSNNILRWLNIDAFALEIPTTCLVGSGNKVIAAWAGASSVDGNRQKSRLGNPLVNELLIGLPDKDRWNRRHPNSDGLLHKYISYPTFPAILNSLFLTPVNSALKKKFATLAPTNFPRADLQAIFLTGIPGLNQLLLTPPGDGFIEYMRLNTSVAPLAAAAQNFLGVIAGDAAGYPNGRRVGDDVIDITLRAAMGVLCGPTALCKATQANVGSAAFIDGSPIAATNFPSVFPYLNTPTPGSLFIY